MVFNKLKRQSFTRRWNDKSSPCCPGLVEASDEMSQSSLSSLFSMSSSSSSNSSKTGPQQRQQQEKKSVRFDEEKNEVREVTHINDFDPDVVEAVWMTEEEFKDIKKNYMYTLYVLSKQGAGALASGEHTFRGLEYRTRSGYYARLEKRRDSCSAVLEEQARQWDEQCEMDEVMYDFDKLSKIYKRYTSKCAADALVRAKKDEDEAMADLEKQTELMGLLGLSPAPVVRGVESGCPPPMPVVQEAQAESMVGRTEIPKRSMRGSRARQVAVQCV